MERLLTRRDVPLREKTLWRVLYETATRASEILALDIENLDLEARRAPVRSSTPGLVDEPDAGAAPVDSGCPARPPLQLFSPVSPATCAC
jgi:integrase